MVAPESIRSNHLGTRDVCIKCSSYSSLAERQTLPSKGSSLITPPDISFSSCVCYLQELSLVLVKPDGTLKSALKKLLSVSARDELLQRTGAKPGDLLLMAAGSLNTVVRDSSDSKRANLSNEQGSYKVQQGKTPHPHNIN